jgi:RNA polymerase sigma factor (sigma-70 family)
MSQSVSKRQSVMKHLRMQQEELMKSTAMKQPKRRRKGRLPIAPEQVPEERRQQYMQLVAEIERLYRTERKRFLGFIRQRVRTQEDAEDILQDVFANVLTAAATVEGPIENVASWVFTAVRNRIIDSYRKKRTESFSDVQTPMQQDEGMESFESLLPDYSYNPEREHLRRLIWEAIQGGLGGASAGAARGVCQERVRRHLLPADGGGDGHQHQHPAGAEALRSTPPAQEAQVALRCPLPELSATAHAADGGSCASRRLFLYARLNPARASASLAPEFGCRADAGNESNGGP